jgi:hypothetical protein
MFQLVYGLGIEALRASFKCLTETDSGLGQLVERQVNITFVISFEPEARLKSLMEEKLALEEEMWSWRGGRIIGSGTNQT